MRSTQLRGAASGNVSLGWDGTGLAIMAPGGGARSRVGVYLPLEPEQLGQLAERGDRVLGCTTRCGDGRGVNAAMPRPRYHHAHPAACIRHYEVLGRIVGDVNEGGRSAAERPLDRAITLGMRFGKTAAAE